MTTLLDPYHFERAAISLKTTVESLDRTLDASMGEPTMSPEDTKHAILSIKYALDDLELVMHDISAGLQEASKKPFLKQFFRK